MIEEAHPGKHLKNRFVQFLLAKAFSVWGSSEGYPSDRYPGRNYPHLTMIEANRNQFVCTVDDDALCIKLIALH